MMKQFWKESSGTVFKMVINQIGMMVFGLIVCTATMKNDNLMLCASIFSALFYLILLYIMTWDLGAKDFIRIEAGRYPRKPFRGVLMSLCANSINLLLALCASLGKFLAVNSTNLSFFTTPAKVIVEQLGKSGAYNFYAVTWNISLFFNAMYTGIIQRILPNCPLVLFLTVLPALAASGLGYFLGSTNRRLFGFLQKKPQDD